LSSNKT